MKYFFTKRLNQTDLNKYLTQEKQTTTKKLSYEWWQHFAEESHPGDLYCQMGDWLLRGTLCTLPVSEISCQLSTHTKVSLVKKKKLNTTLQNMFCLNKCKLAFDKIAVYSKLWANRTGKYKNITLFHLNYY